MTLFFKGALLRQLLIHLVKRCLTSFPLAILMARQVELDRDASGFFVWFGDATRKEGEPDSNHDDDVSFFHFETIKDLPNKGCN